MWPARSAIRPVPAHAQVSRDSIDTAEGELSERGDLEAQVLQGMRDLERQQPSLARWLERATGGVRDETAVALGQYLSVICWRSFVDGFGQRLTAVDEGSLSAVAATFDFDEEIRRGAADELLESDDVVAMGQPHLVGFVREQVEAALEPDEDGDAADVDLDAVSTVYRAVLVEILALGQAVAPPRGVTVAQKFLA